MNAKIDAILREVAELPDRTSPAEHPEMMLVSAAELRSILEANIPTRSEHSPQAWVVAALDGFFSLEGRDMPGDMKAELIAKMLLACTGVQGEADAEPFYALLEKRD